MCDLLRVLEQFNKLPPASEVYQAQHCSLHVEGGQVKWWHQQDQLTKWHVSNKIALPLLLFLVQPKKKEQENRP